jgi:hypothetical protein
MECEALFITRLWKRPWAALTIARLPSLKLFCPEKIDSDADALAATTCWDVVERSAREHDFDRPCRGQKNSLRRFSGRGIDGESCGQRTSVLVLSADIRRHPPHVSRSLSGHSGSGSTCGRLVPVVNEAKIPSSRVCGSRHARHAGRSA